MCTLFVSGWEAIRRADSQRKTAEAAVLGEKSGGRDRLNLPVVHYAPKMAVMGCGRRPDADEGERQTEAVRRGGAECWSFFVARDLVQAAVGTTSNQV